NLLLSRGHTIVDHGQYLQFDLKTDSDSFHSTTPSRAVSTVLKRVVLPELLNSREVERFCTKQTLSQAEIDYRLQTVTKAA
ncbi:uncharacterized protein F5891DRAFT_1101566, partial [Suillus fuscotomentosus]